jgi:hypothetical protein
MSSTIKDQIVKELDTFTDAELRELMASVRSIKGQVRRGLTVGDLFDKYGGSIPTDELDRMEKAIEEGCENIDDEDPPVIA